MYPPIPPLPVGRVEPFGIGPLQPLHSRHQIRLRRFQQNMKVVAHQNIRMDNPARPFAHLPQGGQKQTPIFVRAENRLLAIPPVHHVIDGPRIFQSRFPCHGPISTILLSTVNYYNMKLAPFYTSGIMPVQL